MVVHAPQAAPADVPFDETGVKRELGGAAAKVLAAVALAFSTYQLIIAAFAPLSSLPTRSIHVGFLMTLAFLIHPVSARASRRRIAWYDAVLAALAFALSLYHLVFESALIARSGDPTPGDLIVGTVTVVLLFESARRVLGLALPIICALFLGYGM
ncbi:MAG TPA: TRAP transporter permease, partial [Rubrivivax sp.]|nr:TRAP transporter permease [Rubrivivax sp.]